MDSPAQKWGSLAAAAIALSVAVWMFTGKPAADAGAPKSPSPSPSARTPAGKSPAGAARSSTASGNRSASPSPAGNSNNSDSQGVPPNEESWLVRETSRDLGQLLAFAAAQAGGNISAATPPSVSVVRSSSGGARRAFQVTIKTGGDKSFSQAFALTGSPWDISTYLPWAGPLAQAWQIRPQTAPADLSPPSQLISVLTDPTYPNFFYSNQKISEALTHYPADPSLHEQAALLLAALAWSEAAGTFSDPRETLGAACAFLTMADVLRAGQPRGPAGRLAEAALLVLTGRSVDADQKLTTWLAEPDLDAATRTWLTSLQLANFHDWRESKPDSNASFLHRRVFYRTLRENVGVDKAIPFYLELPKHDQPDWARIAFDSGFSVWAGNVFVDPGMKGEMAELGQLLRDLRPAAAREPNPLALAKFLNETHAGPWQDHKLEVITLGLWASRAQRHLLGVVSASNHHLQNMLGVPVEAAQFRQSIRPLVENLRLAPFLNFYFKTDQSDYDAAMDAVGELARTHPEWVTAANWREVRYSPLPLRYRDVVPHYNSWFDPWLPTGTTFDAGNRVEFYELTQAGASTFDPWLILAPRRPGLIAAALKARGDSASPAAIRTAYGPVLNFNLRAATSLANASVNDLPAYEAAMAAVCALDADSYLILGDILAERGQPDRAAAAYQKAIDLGANQVAVSRDMEFLVNYLYDQNRRDQALALATMAADVYSAIGLNTLARLHLRMGNYAEALKVARQVEERYDDQRCLLLVYHTWKSHSTDPNILSTAADLLRQYFPRGVEQVSLADFATAAAPADGARLLNGSYYTRNNGLAKNDVIVAINGVRVRNARQYDAALDLAPSLNFKVIAWHDGQYVEKSAYLPERRFEVPISNASP